MSPGRATAYGLRAARLFGALGCGVALLSADGEPGKLAPIRLGFSSQVLVELNESDARAALKIWAQTIGAEVDIPVDGRIHILNSTEAIIDVLRAKEIDAVSLTTPEYWEIRRAVPLGAFVIGRVHGELTEEYLLLVHRDHPAQTLADLRGDTLHLIQGAHASLASIWAETLLLENSLGPPVTFWGHIRRANKITGVVLPVFFRQADACIVTLDGFRTMSELNPQVGRQLRILARSPAVVTNVFCFRADADPRHPARVIAQGTRITDTPTGRQILALFQSDKLVEGHPRDLATAFTLLDRHEELTRAASAPTPTSP